MAPIYISAENASAKKIMETVISDNLTVEANRPIVVVGRTSHFLVSFKQGKATLSLFKESDSKLVKLASLNSYYVAVEVIVEAFCLLMSNLGVDLS